MTLKVLNLLPIEDLHTEAVEQVSLDASPEWRQAREEIEEFRGYTL
jgi:hypothetical protein